MLRIRSVRRPRRTRTKMCAARGSTFATRVQQKKNLGKGLRPTEAEGGRVFRRLCCSGEVRPELGMGRHKQTI
jgi:hypothetical protein